MHWDLPSNNPFVALMGSHFCQDLMEHLIGGVFEERVEYITRRVIIETYRQINMAKVMGG